jgi:hypothetical protein
MKINKLFIQVLTLLLVAGVVFALPGTALAQETDPPQEETSGLDDSPENDILVFEPQFYFELPLAQGFKIVFNLGISFEVPRELTLVSDEAYNFILRFSSYLRENALEPVETPEADITPTPEP